MERSPLDPRFPFSFRCLKGDLSLAARAGPRYALRVNDASETRRPLDLAATVSMVVLCATWGFQQVAIKAAAPDVSPVLQVSLRSGVAALIVTAIMRARGERASLGSGNWRPGLLVGLLFASEFLFVAEGLRFTTASHCVMFLYTAPIFAAVGLHLKLPAERLSALQWAGIALALAGVAATFAGRAAPTAGAPPNMLVGDLLALLAAVSWGATTVTVRTTSLSRAPASETLLYQLIGAFAVLLAAAFLLGQTRFAPTPLAWGSLAFQTLGVSVVSFLAWFALLRRYLASRLGALSFLTPLFGIAFGVLLLGEPLEGSFLAGAALVVAGIVLVSGSEWLVAARSRPSAI